MDRSQQEQAARNEVLFREVNERVDEVAKGLAYTEEAALLTEFVCECCRQDCLQKVELTLAQYESVRSNPKRFVVLPGHERTEVERIIERLPGFFVVEKLDHAAEVAIDNDPREDE